MIEESGCLVHPGLPQGQSAWTRDEAKQQQNTGTPPVGPQGRPRRATVGLAARRESDAGSVRTGREDTGGDGNGTRRGAVEGRNAIWCVPGTAGGRRREARRLGRAVRTGNAGRDAGARRSARPPEGLVSGTNYGLGRVAPPEPAGTAPVRPAAAPAPLAPPAPTAPTPAPSDGPAPAEPPAPTLPAAPAPVAPAAPAPAEPAAPVPPEAPAEPPAGPTPATSAAPQGPAAPAPPGRAPPEPAAAVVHPAPAARLQRRANHSRSSCGESNSRLNEAPREATRADPAPPGSAPPGSAPPGSAPPDSVPPSSAPSDAAPPGSAPADSAPPGSVPPDLAPAGSAPVAAPESQLPRRARVRLPETHRTGQDPEGGGGLPGEDLVQGRAAAGGEAQCGRGRDSSKAPTRRR
ncbi:unnamed protein product [Closterium sp. NIES-53]